MKILHAGCGGEKLPSQFLDAFPDAEEIRLDVDPDCKPEIVASISDLGDIGPFDGVVSFHCLEHLQWDDAQKALSEFYRVLKPGGFIYLQVPNIDGIQPTEDVVYEVNGLQITGLDMLYGCRQFTKTNPWMLHRCGFTPATLKASLEGAGFQRVSLNDGVNLDAGAVKL